MKTKTLKLIFVLVILSVIINGCKSLYDIDDMPHEDVREKTLQIIADAGTDEEKAEAIYMFIRDSIKFGWVYPQDIPADCVLANRKGVCMQKAKLLVEMVRVAGLEARFRFMYVEKKALEDFLPDFAYKKWVDPFPHTFPEIYLNDRWVSVEATIDKELHDICIKNQINFGKYKEILNEVSVDFSSNGVKGHQQFWEKEGYETFTGDDLSEFNEFLHEDVPKWKQKMQPMIFRKADKIIDELRNQNN